MLFTLQAQVERRLLGPQSFPAERMYSIFTSIATGKQLHGLARACCWSVLIIFTAATRVCTTRHPKNNTATHDEAAANRSGTAELGVQVRMLVDLNLLSEPPSADPLDCGKQMTCLADYDYVSAMAKDIDVPLDKYLVDS